jgi:hypothetical protein
VLVDLSDWQPGLLTVLQMWWDLFLDVSPAFAGGQDEVVSLEWGCWSGDGWSIVLLRLCRWKVMDLGPRQHGDVPQSTCHSDMCLAACSGPVNRLTKPCWRWCLLRSGIGGGSASLLACVSTALELGGGRWLWWLQETLEIDLYFSISYGFICKVFRIIILSPVCLLVFTYATSCNLIFN